MSSNIYDIATNIDATFPVAGQDNSSQGFRDNFSTIKLAFSTATAEISNLQLNSAQLDQINHFLYVGGINGAKIQNSAQVAVNGSSSGAERELDYAQANYYKITASTSTTFKVTNWPVANLYAPIRLEVAPLADMVTIDFTQVGGVILTDANTSIPYTTTASGSTVWDIWSADNGGTVFVNFVGGPYA